MDRGEGGEWRMHHREQLFMGKRWAVCAESKARKGKGYSVFTEFCGTPISL